MPSHSRWLDCISRHKAGLVDALWVSQLDQLWQRHPVIPASFLLLLGMLEDSHIILGGMKCFGFVQLWYRQVIKSWAEKGILTLQRKKNIYLRKTLPRISLSDRSLGNLMWGSQNHQEKQDMDRTRTKGFLSNISLGQSAHASTFTHRGLSQAISHQKYTFKPTAIFYEKQVFISNQPNSINLSGGGISAGKPLVPQKWPHDQGRAKGCTAGDGAVGPQKDVDTQSLEAQAWHTSRCSGSLSWQPWGQGKSAEISPKSTFLALSQSWLAPVTEPACGKTAQVKHPN